MRGDVHVNTAESFFAFLKRGIHGTLHRIFKRYLGRYADEFSFGWDRREVKAGARAVAALKATEGKRLVYRASAS